MSETNFWETGTRRYKKIRENAVRFSKGKDETWSQDAVSQVIPADENPWRSFAHLRSAK